MRRVSQRCFGHAKLQKEKKKKKAPRGLEYQKYASWAPDSEGIPSCGKACYRVEAWSDFLEALRVQHGSGVLLWAVGRGDKLPGVEVWVGVVRDLGSVQSSWS